MCRVLGIKKTRTTPYHPQSDGMVERFNRTLEAQLSKFADHNHKDWDEHIPFLHIVQPLMTPLIVHLLKWCRERELKMPIDLMFGRPENEPPQGHCNFGVRPFFLWGLCSHTASPASNGWCSSSALCYCFILFDMSCICPQANSWTLSSRSCNVLA